MFLSGKSRGQGSLAGYSPWGCKESDKTERLSKQQMRSRQEHLISYRSSLTGFPFISSSPEPERDGLSPYPLYRCRSKSWDRCGTPLWSQWKTVQWPPVSPCSWDHLLPPLCVFWAPDICVYIENTQFRPTDFPGPVSILKVSFYRRFPMFLLPLSKASSKGLLRNLQLSAQGKAKWIVLKVQVIERLGVIKNSTHLSWNFALPLDGSFFQYEQHFYSSP